MKTVLTFLASTNMHKIFNADKQISFLTMYVACNYENYITYEIKKKHAIFSML